MSPAAPRGSASPLRLAIAGASGRMGRMLIEAALAADDLQLCGALDVASSSAMGQDAAAFLGRSSGVLVSSDMEAVLPGCDVLIDFTRPEGTLHHLQACVRHQTKLVIGTTGFSAEEISQIEAASARIAVVMSPNMSVGVNVVMRLLDVAARHLQSGYDIEIIEAHHRHKVDAPSGTALKMGEVIAHAQDSLLPERAVWSREGHTGPRPTGSIGFSAIRGGDIVGDHTVMFAGTGERIEITHRSTSRAGYAQGSLLAARFLAHRSTGLYGMDAVLGW